MKIVIAEPADFSQRALQLLENVGTICKGPFSEKELKIVCIDADVLMVRLVHYLDAELIESSTLKFILSPTTGLNHIDLNAAEKKQIEIISLKGETAFLQEIPSTAEHTWALLLSLLRKIPAAHNDVLKGNWNRDAFKSRNLNTLTLGILGFGRVGKQLAKYATVFNMEFIFFDTDTSLNAHPNAVNKIEELFAKSDILSIHLPLNIENENFLDSIKIGQLKPGVLVINTSRGELIDENALVAALKTGQIAGLATDVLANELQPIRRLESPLLEYAKTNNNIIITPHIAGATIDSMHLTEEFIVQKFLKNLL